jgi:PAS domain S-box-containing protein
MNFTLEDISERLPLQVDNTTPQWIFDQQSLEFLFVNDAAVERYGYSRQEFLTMTILDIRPIEDLTPLLRETLDPVRRGPSYKEKWRHKRRDGTTFPVEISSCELTFAGRPAELVCAVRLVNPEETSAEAKATIAKVAI